MTMVDGTEAVTVVSAELGPMMAYVGAASEDLEVTVMVTYAKEVDSIVVVTSGVGATGVGATEIVLYTVVV